VPVNQTRAEAEAFGKHQKRQFIDHACGELCLREPGTGKG
jgi:hypothetical protein